MTSLEPLRRRLPLVVFLLLVLLLVMLVGLACACVSDHPLQALERALAGIAAQPALLFVWALLAVSAILVVQSPRRHAAVGRASPALLQRFLL